MYFISPVMLPSVDNPLISVRCPGIILDDGQSELDVANPVGGSDSPELLPDRPSLGVRL